MKKNCLYCKNEFEQLNNKGSEQLYCSKLCRGKAGTERYKSKLINKNNNNETNTGRIDESINQRFASVGNGGAYNGTDNSGYNRNDTREYISRHNGFVSTESLFNVNLTEYVALITENANNKAELKRLTEKVIQLEQENNELMAELDSFDNDEGNNSGIISGLVDSFKSDPQGTVSFASELINNFIKPKTNKNGG